MSERSYVGTLKTTKTANLRIVSQWTRVLMSLDGFGSDKALAVSKAYPTCTALVKRLREPDGKKALENLDVKRTRLGPKATERLYDTFVCE